MSDWLSSLELTSMTDNAMTAILAMLAVTFFARIAGFWFLGQVPITPRVRRGLEALPGAIILSTILPIALDKGLVGLSALGVVVAVMALTRNDILSVALGIGTVIALRAAF